MVFSAILVVDRQSNHKTEEDKHVTHWELLGKGGEAFASPVGLDYDVLDFGVLPITSDHVEHRVSVVEVVGLAEAPLSNCVLPVVVRVELHHVALDHLDQVGAVRSELRLLHRDHVTLGDVDGELVHLVVPYFLGQT